MSLQQQLDTLLAPLAAGRAITRVEGGRASIILDVSGLPADAGNALAAEVEAVVAAVPGIDTVRVAQTSQRATRRLIAVASGKGGVGKSTVSTNLAALLARGGRSVGMVDADIYGPSQPRLLGIEGQRPEARENKLVPVASPAGVPLLSVGQIVPPEKALAWRGPMATNALTQLLDGDWRGIETIIVDMPPGTGDVQLTMIQKHKPAGAIIVSTPQDLAWIDARRAIDLFNQAGVPIIGVVENMAGYVCPHCGEGSDPFGSGGAEAAAAALGIPFLGRVPLTLAIREASDAGNVGQAAAFEMIAGRVGEWIDAPR